MRELLGKYQMTIAPVVKVYRVGGYTAVDYIDWVDVMEFQDLTGEWVTITLDQARDLDLL